MTSDKHPRGDVGRADLLHALHSRVAGEHESRVAEFLGFCENPHETTIAGNSALSGAGAPSQSAVPIGLPPLDSDSPVTFWRAVRAEFTNDEASATTLTVREETEGIRAKDLGRYRLNGEAVDDPPPIAPWSHLRRLMEDLFHEPREIGEINVDALVHELGRGRPVTRLSRRVRGLRRFRLIVLIDRSDRLIPVWRDQFKFYVRFRAEFGSGISFKYWSAGLPVWTSDAEAVSAVSRDLREGDAVLMLGDLGHLANQQSAWTQFGVSLRRQGIATAALLPCPAQRWDAAVEQGWQMLDWERPVSGVGRLPPRGRQAGVPTLILTLLSWTTRIEPELLREARLLVPDADLGTELDAWNHEGVTRHSGGLLLSASLRHELHAQLHALMHGSEAEQQLLRKVIDVVRQRHAVLSRAIWLDEVLQLEVLDASGKWTRAEERRDAIDFARRVRSSLEAGVSVVGSVNVDLKGWAQRSVARVCTRAFEHMEVGDELLRIYAAVERGKDTPLRDGVTPDLLSRVEPQHDISRAWTIRIRGDQLAIADSPARGSPLVMMVGRAQRLFVGTTGYLIEAEERVVPLPNVDELRLSLGSTRVELRRDARPTWAHAMGCDHFGLWASFRVANVDQRMRWIPPGRLMMGSPRHEEGRWEDEDTRLETIREGFWLAETPCTQALWEAVMGENPSEFRGPNRPVERVSWLEVQRFIEHLERGFRQPMFGLPTEAQWEYACRAGTTSARYGELDEIAWHEGNSDGETHPVGLKQANAWGLYDMLGNVWEWCADVFAWDRVDPPVYRDPASGQGRVYRGGGWFSDARGIRAACRAWRGPGVHGVGLGFRLARGRGPHLASRASPAASQKENGR